MTNIERALDMIPDDAAIGIGSGRMASEFIRQLAERVRGGLRVRVVPTSSASERLAGELGIPFVELDDTMPLALTVDGADEWAPNLDLIKGYGRALVREKIIAAASNRLIILVGPGKAVKVLGERGKLPVEVIPLAVPLCEARIREWGWDPVLWRQGDAMGHTDNGNAILDCALPPGQGLADPAAIESRLRAIPGVVGTGLFLGMADTILIGDDNYRLVNEVTRPEH